MAALACGQGRHFFSLTFCSFLSGPFEGRATIAGATVMLKKVTQEDAGQYRCEISAPLDSVTLGETNVTLKVLGKPTKKTTTKKKLFQCILHWTNACA